MTEPFGIYAGGGDPPDGRVEGCLFMGRDGSFPSIEIRGALKNYAVVPLEMLVPTHPEFDATMAAIASHLADARK